MNDNNKIFVSIYFTSFRLLIFYIVLYKIIFIHIVVQHQFLSSAGVGINRVVEREIAKKKIFFLYFNRGAPFRENNKIQIIIQNHFITIGYKTMINYSESERIVRERIRLQNQDLNHES